MDKLAELIGVLIGVVFSLVVGFGYIFLVASLFAFPVEWLWNAILPNLFGFKSINFWNALGILLLTGLLFRGGRPNKSKE